MDGAVSAWVADECDRALGRALSPEEEEQLAELARAAKIEDLGAWKKFDVFEPRRACNVSKQIAQTRWIPTWKIAAGRKSAKARLAAKGDQDPDHQEGAVDTSRCVSLRSPPLRVISLRALKKWDLWSLRIKNASLQAAEFTRGVFRRAPSE